MGCIRRMTDIEIPDPSVVLLVGAAGAGKSTFAARHFPRDAVLSSDAMRAAISGDPADQSVTAAAFAALHRALEPASPHGASRSSMRRTSHRPARRTIRQAASRHGVPVVAIVLDLPAHLVRARNAARQGRPVPDHAVTRHLDQLASVLARDGFAAEGYARVVVLRDPAEVDGLTVRLVPWMSSAERG